MVKLFMTIKNVRMRKTAIALEVKKGNLPEAQGRRPENGKCHPIESQKNLHFSALSALLHAGVIARHHVKPLANGTARRQNADEYIKTPKGTKK